MNTWVKNLLNMLYFGRIKTKDLRRKDMNTEIDEQQLALAVRDFLDAIIKAFEYMATDKIVYCVKLRQPPLHLLVRCYPDSQTIDICKADTEERVCQFSFGMIKMLRNILK